MRNPTVTFAKLAVLAATTMAATTAASHAQSIDFERYGPATNERNTIVCERLRDLEAYMNGARSLNSCFIA